MDQIKHALASGSIRPGEQLPSVRHLAVELKVNPATIVKAYSELEHAGVLVTRRGTGTFVSTERPAVAGEQKIAIATRQAERLVVECRQLGLTPVQVREILESLVRRYYADGNQGETS